MPIKLQHLDETAAQHNVAGSVRKFLDSQPSDVVWKTGELAHHLRVTRAALHHHSENLDGYWFKMSRKHLFWGHPKAIAKLRQNHA